MELLFTFGLGAELAAEHDVIPPPPPPLKPLLEFFSKMFIGDSLFFFRLPVLPRFHLSGSRTSFSNTCLPALQEVPVRPAPRFAAVKRELRRLRRHTPVLGFHPR